MTKILFICHGNICRSPMAEFMLKDMVKKAGEEENFAIASMAATREEIGNDLYPPAKRKLREKGIPFSPRGARQMTRADYEKFDYIIGMDEENLYDMRVSAAGIRRRRSPFFWTGRIRPAMWQTPGIQAILRQPTGIWMRAAVLCCRSF